MAKYGNLLEHSCQWLGHGCNLNKDLTSSCHVNEKLETVYGSCKTNV